MKKISLILLIISIGCTSQNNEEQDTYKILSLITNQLTKIEKRVPYPPRPITANGINVPLSNQDSINMERSHQKNLDKQYIIAIDSIQHPFSGNIIPALSETCQEFKVLYTIFLESEKKGMIDIKKIHLQRKDSLVYFKNEYDNKNRKDYEVINTRLVFSNIVFNSEKSRAIVRVDCLKSKLAGVGLIYFLEKINEKWQIVCEEGLYIS